MHFREAARRQYAWFLSSTFQGHLNFCGLSGCIPDARQTCWPHYLSESRASKRDMDVVIKLPRPVGFLWSIASGGRGVSNRHRFCNRPSERLWIFVNPSGCMPAARGLASPPLGKPRGRNRNGRCNRHSKDTWIFAVAEFLTRGRPVGATKISCGPSGCTPDARQTWRPYRFAGSRASDIEMDVAINLRSTFGFS